MSKFINIFRKAAPCLTAVILFLTVSIVCFAPRLEGRVLVQHDIQQFDGMSRDIRECRATTGEDPQWTGAMFGGMPAYQINIRYPAQFIKSAFERVTGLVAEPIGFLFFAMIAAWLMMVMIGVSPWIGLVVGLAYGLSTYFFLIIGAGHVTKMWALVYAPAMMGAIYMALRGRMWLGGGLAALFAALEIGANHPQITYYFLLAALALWVNDLIFATREKHLRDFGKRTAVLAAAAVVAVGANFSSLFYTAQHTSDTIRGGSEVATVAEHAPKGLDIDYATAWSYGVAESWNMLIPNLMGGASSDTFSASGAVASALGDIGLREWATQLPTYWGDQPYTAGPTYLGAVAIFLALLGVMLAEPRNRWWIAAVSLFAILLSWGHNAMWFTQLCFDYLPMYNKFRTVSMALVVVEWSVPLLAGLALWQLWKASGDMRRVRRALIVATGITAGITLLFAVAGGSIFDFGRETFGNAMSEQFYYMLKESGADDMITKGLHDELGWAVADAMAIDRADILTADAWRSFAFVLLAAAVVALGVIGRLRRGWVVALLGVLVCVDMVPVAFRYLSYDDFVAPRRTKIEPTAADREIMADTSLGYRVLNLSVSPFNDATTSMFHRSVGGYHGAKMGRYQDVIDRYLVNIDERILDMLNTRYIISREGQPFVRSTALGAAWFVERVVTARDAREELESLATLDLATEAVVAEHETLPMTHFSTDGYIALMEYRPNYLRYEYSADAEAFAVFSEIYYDKGWTAYIDGTPAEAMRADYILRGMILPAGNHTVEWRFRAPYWTAVETVTLICSLLIVAGLVALIIQTLRKKQRE